MTPSILPFLAMLKQQQGISGPNAGGPDFSGMESEGPSVQQNFEGAPFDAQMPQQQVPPSQPMAQRDLSSLNLPSQQPNINPPPETKGHLLLRLLQGGLQGGLNGLQQNAQTYAATGRNAGFGGGLAGAMQIPFQRAQEGQELQKGQAQIDILKQQAQNINVPGYGSMPAGLAKVLFPSLIKGQATVGAAQIGAEGRKGAAQIGADARIKAAQMGLGPIADVPQELQDQFGLPAQLPLKMLNTAESAANKPLTVVAGANDSYTVNKQTGQKSALGVGNRGIGAAMARPVQVVDPDNPGNTKWMTSGQAISSGMAGPQSASLSVPKGVMQWATSGKGGEEINSFNTALQHADLLEKAVVAMHNGDVRTLNSLKNAWQREFGSSDITNFNVISNAYSREITKMLSSGHMTDNEIKDQGATLPANASDEQLFGAINSYRALATSKMNMRYNQYQQGLKGKPNFPQNSQPNGAEPTATGANGHKIAYRNGKWVDAATNQPIQ